MSDRNLPLGFCRLTDVYRRNLDQQGKRLNEAEERKYAPGENPFERKYDQKGRRKE